VTFRDARYHIRIKAEMVCNQKINGQVIPVQITENNVLEKSFLAAILPNLSDLP